MRGRLHLPAGLLPQGCLKKSGLGVVETKSARVLLGRAIQQNLLQFLDRPCVDDRQLAILEAGVALA